MTTNKRVNINEILEQLQEIINNADDGDLKTRIELLTIGLEQLQDHMTDSKSGKGVLTRLALAEQEIKNIQEWKGTHGTLTIAEKSGKWQLWAAIATGAITGLISIAIHIINILHK